MNNLRLALCLSLACAVLAHAQAPRDGGKPARGASAPEKQKANRAGGESRAEFATDELLVRFDAKKSRAALGRAHARAGAQVVREFPALGWQLVRLPRSLGVGRALELYRAAPGVTAAQPNYLYRLAAAPNDPRYISGEQYGLAKIGAPAAWDASTGSPSVVVAVIDTGVMYTHEDLQANVWTNPGETPANGIDDDANGYVDDVRGADARNNDGDPSDDHGHGTHVAGTIGAAGNNALGVAGVNWNVRLMAVKIFDAAGVATTAHAIAGLQYVTLMRGRGVNVRVSNSSWGGPPEAPDDDPALREAFRAAGEAGVLNVTAAGNNGRDTDAQPFYPANFRAPNLLSVAASDANDNRAGFSNYGATSVDLAAPGVNILSTIIGPSLYGTSSGTSMASPHVAGAAALLAARHPALSAPSLKATLMNTVDQLPQWSGISASGGRLNVSAALASPTACAFALSPPAAAFLAAGGAGSFTVDTSANCDWAAASSDPSWLTVTSGTPASGDGAVNFSVAPLAGTTTRTATITVGGQTFNVTQSDGCTYQISPASLPQFPAAGGQGTLTMTAPAGCQWSASGLVPWISVTQGGGTGAGTINFTVAPNYGPARSGQILHTDDSFYGITQAGAPAGGLLISEFRIDGPAGSADEFVELYNNTDLPVTVSTTDGSAGWQVVAFLSNGNAPAVRQTVCTVTAGANIPARGHFLCTTSPAGGGGYSLSDYGGAGASAGDQVSTGAGVAADGTTTRFWGLAVFSTANPANFSLANRLDAVNTNFNDEALLGDAPGIDYAGEYNTAAQFSWLRRLDSGRPQDTNNSFSDFILVSTSGGTLGTAQSILGAPGPENLSSPLPRSKVKASLLDPRVASSSAPNRARDTAPHACTGGVAPSNCAFGTLSIRRKFTNSTGAPLTRLRFRILDVTTAPAPADTADLRALSSGDVTVAVAGGTVTARGTTLEQPPTQALGGGLNSTLSAGTVSLATPLAAGASINVQFVLGVQQPGNFRFIINVEALP